VSDHSDAGPVSTGACSSRAAPPGASETEKARSSLEERVRARNRPAEVLPVAAKAGVDMKALYDVVKVSGGWSRWFEGAVPAICKRDFKVTFHLKLALKDMNYMSTLGREYGQPLPMVNQLVNVLDIAKASGLGDENTSALVKLWERMGNVEVRGEGVGQ
jgi:hypothetical protein